MSRGTIEVYYRHPDLPTLRRERELDQRDYDRVGAILPMQEFDSLNQVLDLGFWHFENGGLPRQMTQHDAIVYQLSGHEARTLLVVDVRTDQGLFAGPEVPLARREVFRDPDMPLALWHTTAQWKMNHELRLL